MRRIPLKKARREANLTQAELAELTGFSQAAISRLESGKVPPPRIDEANRLTSVLAEHLGVEPTDLEIDYRRAS